MTTIEKSKESIIVIQAWGDERAFYHIFFLSNEPGRARRGQPVGADSPLEQLEKSCWGGGDGSSTKRGSDWGSRSPLPFAESGGPTDGFHGAAATTRFIGRRRGGCCNWNFAAPCASVAKCGRIWWGHHSLCSRRFCCSSMYGYIAKLCMRYIIVYLLWLSQL